MCVLAASADQSDQPPHGGGILAGFRADYPAILGGLFDVIVAGLRSLRHSNWRSCRGWQTSPHLGEAIGRGLGWPDQAFLAAYSENRRSAAVLAIEESPLAQALLESASLGGLREWTLPATEMLQDLNSDASRRFKKEARWPRSARRA